MIRNVTSCWREERVTTGLYICRSLKPGYADRVRIGAGGNKGGSLGIYGRLASHTKPYLQEPENETHFLRPLALVHAWHLVGWDRRQVSDAEWCMWHAFVTRFPKHGGDLKDASHFVVAQDFDLREVIAEIESSIYAYARVHGAPI